LQQHHFDKHFLFDKLLSQLEIRSNIHCIFHVPGLEFAEKLKNFTQMS